MVQALLAPPTSDFLQKTLGSALAQGATASATLNNTTGVQNLPGVMIVDRVDANGAETPQKVEVIRFTATSGSTVTTLTRGRAGTSDQDHAIGAVVEFSADVIWAQAMYDALAEIVVASTGALDTTKVVTPTGSQTLTNKTLTTPTIASFTNATHNHENAAGGGTIDEDALALTDVTTNDVSTSKHGFTPKAPNDATMFLNGLGAYSVPSASGLTSKLVTFTRDQTTAAGDQAITGVGFIPTSIIILGQVNSTSALSIGFSDSAKANQSVMQSSSGAAEEATSIVYISSPGGTNSIATVKTYDADGFTLTWTKVGVPTGTINCKALCYK